jgi:hypothetical protein
MTTEELHPLTDLFLRRAASNPEEMAGGKWRWVLERIQMHGSQADKDAVQPVFDKIMMDGSHREMMQELLNPEPEQLDLLGGYQNQALRHNQALAKSMAQTKQEVAERMLADAYQNQALTRVQESLTKNIIYKKLGQP